MDDPAPPDLPHDQAGPLGWLETTLEIMRDRSHSSWHFLSDDELLGALHARGAVAAYLPGEEQATRDLVILRLAVSPEGRVAVTRDGRPPEAGDHLQEFVPGLLDELKTVATAPPDQLIGPPWLPVEEIVTAAHQLDEDSRVVYCYQGEDVVASAFAGQLGTTMSVHHEGDWVVCASPHKLEMVLSGPPNRLTGAYPFVVLERRGALRLFSYHEAAKETALHLTAQWRPPLRAAAPVGAHADALELARWLTDPGAWDADQHAHERDRGVSATQHEVLLSWMHRSSGGEAFLPEVAAAFDLPEVAAALVETRPGDPDPAGGKAVRPKTRMQLLRGAFTGGR